MSDQKNLIIAIVLCFLIIFGFQAFVEPPKTDPQTQTQTTTTGDSSESRAPTVEGGSIPQIEQSPVAAAQNRAQSLKSGDRIKIATPNLHGSISLQGGRIDDLTLAGYHETIEPTSAEIALLSPASAPNPYYAEFGWVRAADNSIKVPSAKTLWTADKTELTPTSPVTLTWDNGEGVIFTRHIAIDEDYMFTITQRVSNQSGTDTTLFPYGLISRQGEPKTQGFFILHEGLIGVMNESLNEVDYDDLVDSEAVSDTTTGGWIGITDKFWLTALIPDQTSSFKGRFSHTQTGDRYQADFLGIKGIPVAAGSNAETVSHFFAGAKEVEKLDNYQQNLNVEKFELAIDWGWFYFLTKPIYFALDYLNKLIGNFGLAIITLTIAIKLLLLPLAHKSYVSMSKMKKLQPEMVKLREKHGEDKMKFNQEVMAMYKREKANPAAGCLPIVMQIPIFFALYKVLFVTLLMRHQPFYGWLTDLSAPDPTTLFNLFGLIPWTPPEFLMIGILPLLMGLSMFLQQKLNPQPTDPIQAKIFLFMPLFFMFLLASFPAGLVLYWTCNNVLSIGQQWLIMKRMGVSVNPTAT